MTGEVAFCDLAADPELFKGPKGSVQVRLLCLQFCTLVSELHRALTGYLLVAAADPELFKGLKGSVQVRCQMLRWLKWEGWGCLKAGLLACGPKTSCCKLEACFEPARICCRMCCPALCRLHSSSAACAALRLTIFAGGDVPPHEEGDNSWPAWHSARLTHDNGLIDTVCPPLCCAGGDIPPHEEGDQEPLGGARARHQRLLAAGAHWGGAGWAGRAAAAVAAARRGVEPPGLHAGCVAVVLKCSSVLKCCTV